MGRGGGERILHKKKLGPYWRLLGKKRKRKEFGGESFNERQSIIDECQREVRRNEKNKGFCNGGGGNII